MRHLQSIYKALKLRYFMGLFLSFGLFASGEAIHTKFFKPTPATEMPEELAEQAPAPTSERQLASLPGRASASAASSSGHPPTPYQPAPARPTDARTDEGASPLLESLAEGVSQDFAAVSQALGRLIARESDAPANADSPALAPPHGAAAVGAGSNSASDSTTNTDTTTQASTDTAVASSTLVWDQSAWNNGEWAP